MKKDEAKRLTGLVKPRLKPRAAARRPRWRGRSAEPDRREASKRAEEQASLF
jgi:hypothetical protein